MPYIKQERITRLMKILLGTTNPSKVNMFQSFLEGEDVTIYTLNDLDISDEPSEVGSTPEENAVIKAEYYGRYFDTVICHDSGLYFDALDISDSKQPGLKIRTPEGRDRLSDEEMIAYYSNLVKSLGGNQLAYYLNGMAVYNKGKIYSRLEPREEASTEAFYMVETPSAKRHIGWPLDSISKYKKSGKYFVDVSKENRVLDEDDGAYNFKVIWSKFIKESLGL